MVAPVRSPPPPASVPTTQLEMGMGVGLLLFVTVFVMDFVMDLVLAPDLEVEGMRAEGGVGDAETVEVPVRVLEVVLL